MRSTNVRRGGLQWNTPFSAKRSQKRLSRRRRIGAVGLKGRVYPPGLPIRYWRGRGFSVCGHSSDDMATCKFCREAMHDDASRCPHCSSMVAGEDDRRVTYVVDRDLIRFAKFALAVLGVFVIFGAFAFGFKIEVAVEHARDLQKEMSDLEPKLRDAATDLATARADLEKARVTAQQLSGELDELRRRAQEKVVQINAYLVSFQQKLTPVEQQTAAAAAQQLGGNQQGFLPKLWPNGSTLMVGFMEGDTVLISRVKSYMEEWISHTNLHIRYVPSKEAQVRASFRHDQGSWSTVGTDALGIARDQPTINFGELQANSDEADVRRVVLHEFGHTLGLVEEMKNPKAEIPWNRAAIIAELTGPRNRWSKKEVEQNMFDKESAKDYRSYRAFDPTSIMMFAIPASWTDGKLVVGSNDHLSAGDQKFISQLYPR